MGKRNDLKGTVALVTGACSGIGLEFCRRLAERGADIVMVSNRDRELREAAAGLSEKRGVRTWPLTIDLCRPDAAGVITAKVDELGLDVSMLINDAGIFSFAPVVETPERKADCFIDLHVRAVTSLTAAFARRFVARGGGRILNMSSMSCWTPMPGIALYAATKAYIRVFSRAMAYELADSGVTLTVACPGGIATDLFGLPENLKRLAVSIGALQTPEQFTRKALRRMLKGKRQYINGLLNRIGIVAVGMAPTPLRMAVKRRMLDKGIRR